MKKTLHLAARRGFTLIEMLVVIGIIGILASLAVPAATGVMKKAKKVKTSAALKDIQIAIKMYQQEYNRYPIRAGTTTESPIALDEGSSLLKILLGENDQKMNPREIKFIEPTMGKNGSGGLTGTEGNYGLKDSWGEPYQVLMDANYDNKIANPDTKNEDKDVSSGAPANLPVGVAVYSHGEDKKPNTKDDIVSWRP
jgi:prepilin-type N-terminal cleavage/methylation domain-containing protein